MGKRNNIILSLAAAAALALAACGGGSSTSTASTSIDCASIAGTWHWHRLQSGSSASWARFTETIASDCTDNEIAFLDSDGNTVTRTSTVTWSLDTSAILTRADVPTLRGMVMLNDRVIVSTRTAGDGVSVRMAVGVKAGSGFSQVDLEGTQAVRLLRTGTTPLWAYGTVTHDAAGNATSFWDYSSGGSGAGTASLQSLNAEGLITDSLNATWEGRLSAGKEFMAATATMPDGSLDLIVGTGAATGFSTADLAGEWRWHRLQAGAGSHWARGRISVDSAGAVTQLSYGDSDGGNTAGAPFTLSMDAAGAITRADNLSYHGQMLASKNAVIAVQSNGTGDAYRLMIYRKE